MLIGALIIFLVGFILSIMTEWSIIGIILIVISIIILLIGLFFPERRRREMRGVRERMATSPIRKAEMPIAKEEKETPRKSIKRITKRSRR